MLILYRNNVIKVVRGKTWTYYYLNSKWDRREIKDTENILFIW